jgi:hypothetical protein
MVRQSALRRRRARASYALNNIELVNRRSSVILCFAVGCLLVVLVGQANSIRVRQPRAYPLALSNSTKAHGLDRFSIEYVVRDGDNLWLITSRIYGKPSFANIRKLRAANPSLPKKDEDLRIGVILKLPLADGHFTGNLQ